MKQEEKDQLTDLIIDALANLAEAETAIKSANDSLTKLALKLNQVR